MAKNTAQKSVLSMFDSLPEKKETKKEPVKKTAAPVKEKPKKAETEAKPVAETAPVNEAPRKTQNKGGRPNTRGEMYVDSKRISLVVPTDLFEKIKDNCRGNMTKFITDILRERLGD